MDINHLHEFVTLAEVGNYLKAADQLFIAQSALSRHIQGLEKDLGVQLFDRSTRSVKLSEYGEIFLPYARDILKIQYKYSTEFYNRMNNIASTITVGCLPVTLPYHIPEMLAKFSKENKNFTITLTKNDNIEQLRNHTADFVFIRETGDADTDIAMLQFDTDSLAALLPSDHPLAKRKTLHLEELKHEHFLFLSKHTKMYELCENACNAAGFEPQIIYSGPSADNMIVLVREHIGIGLLTKKPLQYIDHENISIIDIKPKISTAISLAYLKDETLSPAATHFIKCIRSFIADRASANTGKSKKAKG